MREFKYRAFISYSHRDDGWATWLHRTLEGYRPPRRLVGQPGLFGPVPKRLAPIFRDRDELPTATDLGTIINQALDESACQLVICSPDAARSKWVNEEILAYKQLGREDRIFCLIVGGEPNASDRPELGLEECFPEALRYKIGPDGELTDERTEPIAADARPGKDGKANAKLKIIAGMLGVGFDALRQRELHRRQRKLVAVASAAVVGMVITTGLAALALIARAEAERESQTAQQTSRFMVEMFSVSDPSEARGNSITALEILDRGARRVETELADEPIVQSELMDTMGNVYASLGLLNRARPMLEGALARRREFLGPDDPDTAITRSHLANLERLDAEFEASEREYLGAIATQRRALGDEDPAVATSLTGLAELQSDMGRFEEAESTLREALAIRRAAFGEEHTDYAQTLENLAMMIGQQGDLETAIDMMEDALAILRRYWGDEPQTYVAEAITSLAVLLYATGDYERTESLLREALGMSRRLYGEHPDLAQSINNLAIVLHDQDDFDQAEKLFREALEIQAAAGDDRPDYANALNNLAYVQYDQGDVDGALLSARTALQIYAERFPDGHFRTADTLAGLGAWLLERGELDEAEQMIRGALVMRESLFGTGHTDYANSEVQLAMLFVARNRFDEALEVARRARRTLDAELSPAHWRSAMAAAAEGAALAGLGEYDQAESLLKDGLETLSGDPGTSSVYVHAVRRYLHDLYLSTGRPQQAAAYAPAAAAADSP